MCIKCDIWVVWEYSTKIFCQFLTKKCTCILCLPVFRESNLLPDAVWNRDTSHRRFSNDRGVARDLHTNRRGFSCAEYRWSHCSSTSVKALIGRDYLEECLMFFSRQNLFENEVQIFWGDFRGLLFKYKTFESTWLFCLTANVTGFR